jgi:membrane protein implicated in regulation of membrane protease activity
MERVPAPPPAPRNVPRNYIWRILIADGGAITGGIFLFIGGIFFVVGVGLTIGIVTAFVGLPFAGIGLLMLAVGIGLLMWRYREAQRAEQVLKDGEAVLGKIVDVYQNFHVQVNGRHPWSILYRYQVAGEEYQGKVTTLMRPDMQQQPEKRAYVLYLPDEPGHSTIYPHPYGYHRIQ